MSNNNKDPINAFNRLVQANKNLEKKYDDEKNNIEKLLKDIENFDKTVQIFFTKTVFDKLRKTIFENFINYEKIKKDFKEAIYETSLIQTIKLVLQDLALNNEEKEDLRKFLNKKQESFDYSK